MTREVKILTPEHVELSYELAGIGSRFIAHLLDTLLVFAIMLLIFASMFAIIFLGMELSIDKALPYILGLYIAVLSILPAGYFLYFESMRNGQTPGKKAVGIRVIRDTGHPIDFRAAFLRNVMRPVDYLPFGAPVVGFISVLFSSEYRRLGDYVAGTLVVKTGQQSNVSGWHKGFSPPSTPETYSGPTLPREALPYLHDISVDDYRAVRHFLDRRVDLSDDVVRALAGKLASPLAEKLHIAIKLGEEVEFLMAFAAEWERRMVH